MLSLKVFFVSEARAQLFKLLKMVEQGEDVVVVNKENNAKFKISLLKEEAQTKKHPLLKKLASSNLKSKSPQDIKRILELA